MGYARLSKRQRRGFFDEDMHDPLPKNMHHVHAASLLHAHRLTGTAGTIRTKCKKTCDDTIIVGATAEMLNHYL